MAFKDYIKGKKLVGKKTNLKTTYKGKPVNRPVYINKDGERVSEQSRTFKYNNKVINIPTIHRGYQFKIPELRAMLDEGLIKPTSVSKANLTSKATGNPTANLKTQYKTMGKKAGERSKNLRMSR
jgi:hypothetical protein|tara:strand:- start:1187 stop:1561 length:375 start_codon:yes stop_codon:yes gene_type:complete